MSFRRRSRLLVLVVLCLLVPGPTGIRAQAAPSPVLSSGAAPLEHPNPALPTLWLIGNGGLPEASRSALSGGLSVHGAAWTPAFAPLLDPTKVNLLDRSEPDSSSRAYSEEQPWQDVLSHLRPGDFVLIQFAQRHRVPETVGRDTEELPGVSDEIREIDDPRLQQKLVVHTYGWYLRQYAVEAIAHGATPILCSPLPADTNPLNADISWSRAIAVQQRIPFVDLSGILSPSGGSLAATDGSVPRSPGTTATAQAIVARLKALTSDPLSGYFSAQGNVIPAAPATAPQSATTPPL